MLTINQWRVLHMDAERKAQIKAQLDRLVEGTDKAADPLLTRLVASKWTGVIVTVLLILWLILWAT